MKKLSILSVIIVLLTIVACSKSDSGTTNSGSGTGTGGTTLNCSTIDSRFSAVVFPIIQNSCGASGCHNAGSANGPGALTNFTQIKAAAASIKVSVENGSMPKGSTLTTAQKNAISCWVSSGGLNN
jgi:hypothetical protein